MTPVVLHQKIGVADYKADTEQKQTGYQTCCDKETLKYFLFSLLWQSQDKFQSQQVTGFVFNATKYKILIFWGSTELSQKQRFHSELFDAYISINE